MIRFWANFHYHVRTCNHFILINSEGCGTPEDNDSVYFAASSSTVGSIAYYECRPGYENIVGPQERECLSSGEWEGSVPTCSPKGKYMCTEYGPLR